MSDRTGRTPLGTQTKHPADWFSDYLYVAGRRELNKFVGVGEMYTAIGVLNNDDSGRVMKIWGATANSEGGGGMLIYMPHGSIGSQVDVARSIRPDRAAPTGLVFSEHQQVAIGAPNPFDFGLPFGEIASPGFDSGTFLSPFPLFIVPVGYSIVATNPESTEEVGMFWWFTLAAR